MPECTYMRKAIRLAERGRGFVSPNPMVGAVLVRHGHVIGQGWHRRFGGSHAEVEAIAAAGDCRGATLYVTLEPCSHFGKTPPCTEALVKAGIAEVYAGTLDPNPLVSGRGIKYLEAAGIAVHTGLLEEECRRLNEGFFTFISRGRALATWKAAFSLDGRIALADGNSRWITGEASRRYVQTLRARHDAVMAGNGTLHQDDPKLDYRCGPGACPARVIVSSQADVPVDAALFQGRGRLIVAAVENAPPHNKAALTDRGATVLTAGSGNRVDLSLLMKLLPQEGILSVLLEGGPTLATAMLENALLDRAAFFIAPKLLGSDSRPLLGALELSGIDEGPQFTDIKWRRFGCDTFFEAGIERKA